MTGLSNLLRPSLEEAGEKHWRAALLGQYKRAAGEESSFVALAERRIKRQCLGLIVTKALPVSKADEMHKTHRRLVAQSPGSRATSAMLSTLLLRLVSLTIPDLGQHNE
jgi:hypothetical protein